MMMAKPPQPKRGWMTKKARGKGMIKNWRLRFFILEDGKISYYEKADREEQNGIGLKGSMKLLNASIMAEGAKQPNHVYVCSVAGEENDMLMAAENEAVASEWKEAIREHCRFANSAGTNRNGKHAAAAIMEANRNTLQEARAPSIMMRKQSIVMRANEERVARQRSMDTVASMESFKSKQVMQLELELDDCKRRLDGQMQEFEGIPDMAVAETWHEIATYQYDLGKTQLAVESHRNALEIEKQCLKSEEPSSSSSSAAGAGKLTSSTRATSTAAALFGVASEDSDELPNHAIIGETMYKISLVLYHMDSKDEALEAAEKALTVRRAALGAYHADVGDVLDLMAIIYDEQSRTEEAVATYEQALEVKKETLGERHEEVADTLFNLAAALATLGRDEEAREARQQAAHIRKQHIEEKFETTSFDERPLRGEHASALPQQKPAATETVSPQQTDLSSS